MAPKIIPLRKRRGGGAGFVRFHFKVNINCVPRRAKKTKAELSADVPEVLWDGTAKTSANNPCMMKARNMKQRLNLELPRSLKDKAGFPQPSANTWW